MKSPLRIALLTITLALAAAGCEVDDSDVEAHADQNAEACTHMASGTSTQVAAPALGGETPPDVTAEHTRIEITLAQGAAGNGGVVAWSADEAGDYAFFLSADAPFVVVGPSGEELAIEDSSAVEECAAVAVRYDVELGIGLHTLVIGPTPEASVDLVVEHVGDHGHAE
jgi:hypothetical protein